MMGYYLNQGVRYAHSGESSFARLLRIVATNPGVPIQVLISEFVRKAYSSAPIDNGLGGRDSAHYVHSAFSGSYAHGYRHCPSCYQQLFHTLAYQIPALTRCPIHGVALTLSCPQCNEPWPDIVNIRKRSCSGCGLDTLSSRERLHDSKLSSLSSELINPCLEVIHKDYPVVSLLSRDYDRLTSEITLLSPHGLEFVHAHLNQMGDHRRSRAIEVLGLEAGKLHSNIERLKELPVDQPRDVAPFYADALRQTRYMTLGKIITWIREHSTVEHELNHETDRNVDAHSDGSPCCPICTALMIWLHLNSDAPFPHRIYKYFEDFRRYRYAFSSALYKARVYTSAETTHHEYYPLPKRFVFRMYGRDLEYEFVELLTALTGVASHNTDLVLVEQTLAQMRKEYLHQAFFIENDTLAHYYALHEPLSLLRSDPTYDHEYPIGRKFCAIIPGFNSSTESHLRYWMSSIERYSALERQLMLFSLDDSREDQVERWFLAYCKRLNNDTNHTDQFTLCF